MLKFHVQPFFKLRFYYLLLNLWWMRGCYLSTLGSFSNAVLAFSQNNHLVHSCSKNLLGDDLVPSMFPTWSHIFPSCQAFSSQFYPGWATPCVPLSSLPWPPLCNAGASCLAEQLQGPWPSRPPERPSAPDPTHWNRCVDVGCVKDADLIWKGGWAWCLCTSAFWKLMNDMFPAPTVKQFQDVQRKAGCCVCHGTEARPKFAEAEAERRALEMAKEVIDEQLSSDWEWMMALDGYTTVPFKPIMPSHISHIWGHGNPQWVVPAFFPTSLSGVLVSCSVSRPPSAVHRPLLDLPLSHTNLPHTSFTHNLVTYNFEW